jgi:hypothetical protein
MNKINTDYLYKKYPKIFKQHNLPMTETCMCWGFDCNDGWFWLIDNLCKTIQSYIDDNKHLNISQVEATQVKEKFGGLRFYYIGGDKLIEGMVWLAESLSYSMCEKCGSLEGKSEKENGWITTLCDKCRDGR